MKKFIACLFALMLFMTAPAFAQRAHIFNSDGGQDRIVAVVNDNVITTNDMDQRLKLALLASGLPDSPEVRDHLMPQILRGLIDEQLQMQEAKRLDISISKQDIDQAMERIAQDNHIPIDMRSYIQAKGGSAEALEQQIRSGLAWNKVIQRELRPRVEVGDDEVDTTIARIKANAGKEEYLVSEIFLAVDNPKDEEQVHQVAENLEQQIKNGASFQAVARQFSQSTGAASGGDIGWIQEGQLSPDLNKVLTTMQTGQISGPVRSSSGYHLLALRDKRTISLNGNDSEDATLSMQQAFRPILPGENRGTVIQEAQTLRGSVANCAALPAALHAKFTNWRLPPPDSTKMSQVPAMLTDKIRDVPAGKSSQPLVTDKGIIVIFICNRQMPQGKIDREAIMNGIGSEKLELQARRELRDLRRNAYIDIRIGKDS
jgi:peptidyl-prolyl cis-trans isomerase SurA